MGFDARAHTFVAIPFAKTYDKVYAAIEAAVKSAGLEAIRADKIPRGGPFIDNVYNAIEQAGIVIGVTSRANPNVAYELGFARRLNKETILLTNDVETIPADLRDINHIVYSPRALPALSKELARWLENSRFLSVDPAERTILRRGEVFETVVDGTFYLQKIRPTPSKEEIRHFLTQGLTMPQRLLYLTEEGQATYLRLCDDPQYSYYQETVHYIGDNSASLVDAVLGHCESSEVDFISLGPGNGQKDAALLDELLGRASSARYTYYYPYDVSGGLLLEALRNILVKDLPLQKLRVKAIEADVAYLGEFKRVFDYRPEPNVYSLLGGLGNMGSEVDLLTLLRRLMGTRDCLLLEVRRKADARVKGLGRTDLNRQLDLAALRYVGAKVEQAMVTYEDVPSTSTIPDTRTIAGVAEMLELDRRTFEDVSLFAVHYYEPNEIQRMLEKVGFKVLTSSEQENSLFYVCAKR